MRSSSNRSATSRCCVPSWRSRSNRRRASSAAATIRARDAISSARAVAFDTAVATSSVNCLSLISERSGIGSGCVEIAMIVPQVRPSTMIGAPTADRISVDISPKRPPISSCTAIAPAGSGSPAGISTPSRS
jgi:hypothetical protein